MIIAFDGTACSGKSTIAKAVAKKLGFIYLNTGEIYRSFTSYFIDKAIAIIDVNREMLNSINVEVKFIDGRQITLINDIDYSSTIRSAEVSKQVSLYSPIKALREKIRLIQRSFSNCDLIIEGRDICSVVFPNADYKFFIDADVDVRAQRRYLQTKDVNSFEEVKKFIIERDNNDQNRKFSPLYKTDNSILIDTTHQDLDTSVNNVIQIIRR